MKMLRLVPSVRESTTFIDAFVGQQARHQTFYRFEPRHHPGEAGIGNAALLAFLPYAMHHRLAIHVEAPVDFDLLVKLKEAQDAWTMWHKGVFQPVTVTADEVRSAALPQSETAVLAFSGGLDATYALHAHCKGLIGRRSLDVRAAVLVQGLDVPLARNDWFSIARDRALKITDTYGVPLVTVQTNWRGMELPWEQTHVFAIASVLHQFKGVIGHGIIAADEPYDGEVLGWGSNSITNQMMSGVSFPIQFTGAGKRRTEKAKALRDVPNAYRNLRVCWERPSGTGNCGECEKCIRTKLNLLAAGIGDTSALGGPVTAAQIRRVLLKGEVPMGYFRELSALEWHGHPEIKTALNDLVMRGIQDKSSFRERLLKFKRSMSKRGLWPQEGQRYREIESAPEHSEMPQERPQ